MSPRREIERRPIAVVGAGAAGLLAAIFAARRGAAVLLLESRPRPGAKIRVSGGGRCNLLPVHASLDDFHTGGSAMALRNVLLSWPLAEVRSFFELELGVKLKDEPSGKVFPVSERPLEVVAALLGECERRGVKLVGGFRAAAARRLAAADGGGFELESDDGRLFRSGRLVLATGGLSLPKTGSDGGGLELARALGHSVSPTYPALVPLASGEPRWRELAGVSLRVRLRAVRGAVVLEEREGDFLFTHRGFSGPAVLDISRHFAAPGGGEARLLAGWGGAFEPGWDAALRAGGRGTVLAVLRERLPRRLAEALLAVAGIAAGSRTSELSRETRRRLAGLLEGTDLQVCGNEGYATAEVTGGGVPLAEVSPRTLESRIAPGLHLAGEMLDVIGRIGGYNFLWAWVSGRKAGEGAAVAQGQLPK